MKLKPLQQWLCDTCGEIIERPGDGWIEWVRGDDGQAHSFRICHHAPASPLRSKSKEGCYLHGSTAGRQDVHLDNALGVEGVVELLSWVDVGNLHDPEGGRVPRVRDIRNWIDTFKRLQIPHYEEARGLFETASSDGYYEGDNETNPYRQSKLKSVIEKYGE